MEPRSTRTAYTRTPPSSMSMVGISLPLDCKVKAKSSSLVTWCIFPFSGLLVSSFVLQTLAQGPTFSHFIQVQSTPALRTPRYYGHPAITDSSKIPGESYRRLTEINSLYYGLSLLRTYGHFIRSQRHNFIVFSLVIADTEQHLGIFAHISSVFFLLFETVFVFFGRFPLLLSINQNSFIFFS